MADNSGYRPRNPDLERLILIVLGGVVLRKFLEGLTKGWPQELPPMALPPAPPQSSAKSSDSLRKSVVKRPRIGTIRS